MTTLSPSLQANPHLPSSSSNNLETPIYMLNPESIHNIFSYLRSMDLRASTAAVCTQWSEISRELLIKEDKQEYKNIQESITFLTQKFDSILDSLAIDLLAIEDAMNVEDDDDDDDDDDLLNQKNDLLNRQYPILNAKENLNAIKTKTEIKSSFELKKQVLEQLTPLHANNFQHLVQLIHNNASSHVRALVNLAMHTQEFLSWSKFQSQNMLNQHGEPAQLEEIWAEEQFKIDKLHEVCLKLIELNAFGTALNCASAIQTQNPMYKEKANNLQETAFAKIASALAQQGYFGQALEIANKDIFAGPKKIFALKSIFTGLKMNHLFGQMRETIDQIPAGYTQAKTEFQQILIESLTKSGNLEDALKAISSITDKAISLQELKKMGEEFFKRNELDLAEKTAHLTNNYSLLVKLAVAWVDQKNGGKGKDLVWEAIKMILNTLDKVQHYQELNKIGKSLFCKGNLDLAEVVARSANDYSFLAEIAIAWSDQGDMTKGTQVVLATPAGEARTQVLSSIVTINGLRAMRAPSPSILKTKT